MSELSYALECGVQINVTELPDGTIQATWANGQCIEIISKDEATTLGLIKNETVSNLTEKETKVLTSMYNNTYEIGLPIDTDDIKNDTNYSKRTIVGVLSSLYKKGYVESYDLDQPDEYMISEEGYDLITQQNKREA